MTIEHTMIELMMFFWRLRQTFNEILTWQNLIIKSNAKCRGSKYVSKYKIIFRSGYSNPNVQQRIFFIFVY